MKWNETRVITALIHIIVFICSSFKKYLFIFEIVRFIQFSSEKIINGPNVIYLLIREAVKIYIKKCNENEMRKVVDNVGTIKKNKKLVKLGLSLVFSEWDGINHEIHCFWGII